MRVAVLHNHPIHYKHLLFKEMKNAGIDFKAFFFGGRSSIRHEQIPLNSETYEYQIGFNGPYEAAPFACRVRFAWTSLVRENPGLVIIGGFYAAECWVAWLWARLHRRPAILWYECNEFDKRRFWWKERIKRVFVRGCERAHVYGVSNRAYVVKLGMRPEHVEIKRAVADVAKFSVTATEKTYSAGRKKRIIYVGRLAPEKNLPTLLKALAIAVERLRQPLLELTIVGTGPLQDRLRKLCVELGIENQVRFAGYCPQKELAKHYKEADFFVLPSTYEPWGLVVCEAMLCRLPVLSSIQCGCTEDLITPETGWKFSPWHPDQLANLLTMLPDISFERIAKMGAAAHELASGYSAEECARRVAASIASIRTKRLGDSKQQEAATA